MYLHRKVYNLHCKMYKCITLHNVQWINPRFLEYMKSIYITSL